MCTYARTDPLSPRDALDLLREIGEADDRSDRSHWDLPSISPHWQNRRSRDWIALIELLRDAWLVTRETNPERATQIAQGWFALPYSAFKRLALFAASHDGCIPADQWVGWLLIDESWCLWSTETQRETMRLLVLQGAQLSPKAKARLEAAILAGPPRSIYGDDAEPERLQSLVDRKVWVRLAKLQEKGGTLGDTALQHYSNLSAANPKLRLASNERDEFSHWMSGTGDSDYEESRDIDIAPHKRRELVNWLKRPTPTRPFYEDTWRDVCRKHLLNSGYALWDLSLEGIWPAVRWLEALQAWSERGGVARSWRFFARLVRAMPDKVLEEIAQAVSWWLEVVSKSIDRDEAILLDLCSRILSLPNQDGEDNDQPVTRAINHPVGHVTQALLNLWFRREPNDNDMLPIDIEPFFTQLCDTPLEKFRHGRVLLASRLIALFRVDRPWTELHLLPLFDWIRHPGEAKAAWEGFLWSPRLYRPLLIAFKVQFLDTAHHYGELGEHSRQFAAFLTYAALDLIDGYAPHDFQSAIGALPQKGLQQAAQALVQALEGAGEQREKYWKNRVQPFWQQVWPKSLELSSNGIAASLARLSIAARGEFPRALAAVVHWLRPIEHPHYVVHRLHELGLAARFPEATLHLLDAVLDDQSWAPPELGQCLTAIAESAPALEQDSRYQRLVQYSRRRGI